MRLRQLLGIILLVGATMSLAAAQTSTEARHVSRISNITVVQDKDGLNVEISGDSSIITKAMKLNHPDRIVVDIPDSILEGQSRQISVNSADIKDVRAARYQSSPPTTRIVVDMAAMHDFEVLPMGNKVVLKLKTGDAAMHAASANTTSAKATPVSPASPSTASGNAAPVSVASANKAPSGNQAPVAQQPQPVAVAQPEVKPVTSGAPEQATLAKPDVVVLVAPGTQPDSKSKTDAALKPAKGDQAATHFIKPAGPALVSANQPPLSGNASLKTEPAVVNAVLHQQQQVAQTPANTTSSSCTSGHYSGAPLNLDLKDLDIKDFFRLIHELSGLNVVLDPGVKGIVTIDVTDIPWDQALAIVLRNNGLECELEGNVLRIATLETLRAEAEARRAQQEAQALAVPKQNYTRYLSYAHSKDVVTILKKFLSARGDIVSDERSNAVIIEDIPSTLPKVDALLTELDRKTPEVEIEARVVSAQRTFLRDIGTQLGFGWGNSSGTTGTGGGTGVADPITQTFPAGVTPPWITIPNQPGQIPLFSNLPATNPTSGLSIINSTGLYRLDFTLTMAESRGLVKILSRPRVVTQNNIAALIRQGQRIPVVTLSQLGGPPTVTYVDAFLRLTVTPQITSDNTIFLLLDVENTTPDFSHVTGQQLNPTLDTQQTTTQVLVSDGQTVVIGGVIQTQNSLAINQVPLLGSIPLLGNLFKHTSINTSTAELLFFITPKIIQT